ncbi:MAG: hypothetical protein ABIY48_11590 [Acidimicrobiales bacterium]
MGLIRRKDRRGANLMFLIALALMVYAAYSLTIAGTTAEQCSGQNRTWHVVPPRWECTGTPGFG